MVKYNGLSDTELTDLLKSGDHAAYTEIYHRYWPVLFRHARKMLRDDDEATDVVQEVFATFWSKSAELIFTVSLSSYLYSATRNKIIDLVNRNKLKTNYLVSLQAFIDKGEFITDNAVREHELSNQIESEIARLPKKMRQIFELSRKQNLSYKQIADEIEISEGTVKKQISNAIKILKIKLGSLYFLFF
ncbi:RNA polymerase sigma-70 factor [Pedobacter nyackensis]|uniref:RNA polymerase sigma factor n=1 Tax=Pedobacter nyackensis TaxID=475255 RepID=UPI00292D80E3|nr:RNA polymerase sigma-70 factor [Pedobacter nyackensis]